MNRPLFSVINTAIRQDRYEAFYQSLSYLAKVPFEVVFAGDKPPLKPMPSNFRYIETSVKPVQCLEITARKATGEYLIPVGDDQNFSENYLNKMSIYVSRLADRKIFLSSRYSLEGVMHDDYLTFDPALPDSPLVGIGIVVKKEVWHELGGVDSRFVAAFPDVDMQMRLFEAGYTIFITPDCVINEVKPTNSRTLFRQTAKSERIFLNSLWVNENGFSKSRLSSVESFDDFEILKRSQGNTEATGKNGSRSWS